MKIDLKQLFDIPGERCQLDALLDLSKEQWHGLLPFTTPVKLTGVIENRAEVVTLSYQLTGELALNCDRCLTPFSRPLDESFSHILVRSLNTDNDDYLVCADSMLDLSEQAMADLYLTLPNKVLCKEDCKGLCEQCGKDLNLGDCGCKQTNIDPRLAVLSQLL